MKTNLEPKSILLPSPVLIIGSYGPGEQPNMMNAAWGGIVCSQPPCIGVAIREATLTYHNILLSEAFTVNFPSEKFIKEADYVGIVSGKNYDKFKETGLTPERSAHVNAPTVKEFPYALECKLIKHISLGSHMLFIGEIIGMLADSEILGPNQLPDIEKVRPMLWGSFGNMSYYGVGEKLGKAFSIGKDLLNDK